MPVTVMAVHSDYGCDGCHAPHDASALPGVPLWSGRETTTTFTSLYSSDTLDAVPGQPDGASKLCLGCHDGVTDPNYVWMGADVTFGADELADTHPISFVYDSALATADGALKDPSEDSGLGGTIYEDLLHSTGKVQCNSCHDVHTTGVGDNAMRGMDYFHGAGGGQFCRMCHEK